MSEDQVNAAVLAAPAAGVRAAPVWRLRLGTWAMGWDDVARAGLVAAVLLVILSFRSYGLIWDEEWQAIYGHKILAWYTSFFSDDSSFTYLNLHFYGGAFDLVAALVNRVSPLGEYETRHLMGGLVGVLGLAGAWRLGQRMGGPRAGALAAALLLLIPGFWGHAFFNPKDVPFAVAMVWTLVWAVRLVDQLPRPRPATVLAFGAVLGLALGTRIGGVLMLVYLAPVLGAYLALELWQRGLSGAARAAGAMALALLPALMLAYVVMVVVWPWALQAPLNPWRAFTTFAHFTWPGEVLAFGRHLSSQNLPWWYLPGQLLVQLPEVVLAGLALAGCFGLVGGLAGGLMGGLSGGRARPSPMAGLPDRLRGRLPLVLVALAALFPIAYFIAFKPAIYHGYRHFIFVVPPLAVLAALGLDRTLVLLGRHGRRAGVLAAGVLLSAMGWQAVQAARLFPNEYIYYNSLVGGVQGAEGRFNLDYWGNALHEGADLLNARIGARRRADGKPWRVLVCGYPLSAAYYLGPNFATSNDSADADFYLAFTEGRCDRAIPGTVIGRVARAGVTLAVLKDRRNLLQPDLPRPASR